MDEGSHREFPRRKRVSRACDRCRSKKDKCDGARPACSACQASGLPCSYDPHSKKRGLPEGYVRGLEKLWALSLCNVEGLENTLLTMLGATPESAERGNRTMNLWADESASESLHNSWKTSRLFGTLEKMLSGTDFSQSLGKRSRGGDGTGYVDRANTKISAESEWGFRVRSSSVPSGLHATCVLESSTMPETKRARLSVQPDNQSSPETVSNINDSLWLPPQTSQLLDVYFTVTHSWLPIVAKHSILRASYNYANSPFSIARTSPGSGDHAALWAIFSYTTANSASQDALLPKMKEYYAVARGLIPLDGEGYEMGHVQALLLLALVNIGLEDWTAAWLLSGQAARMVTGMNVGFEPGNKKQDKSIFLGCFVVDTFLSFRLSRTPCMRPEDLDCVGLLEEDGLEEWNSWSEMLSLDDPASQKRPPGQGPVLVLSCFNRLVKLARVLNMISCDTSTGSDAYAFAQQHLLELEQWEGHLPQGCRLLGPDSVHLEQNSPLLPHQSYLCLTYIATVLRLYAHRTPREQTFDWPTLESSRKLLYRVLPLVSQRLESSKFSGFPPIFEIPLRTIAQQALTLQNRVGSDAFPFSQWAEAILQCTSDALGPTWPVFRTLMKTIDDWKRPQDPPENISVSLRGGPVNGSQFTGGPSDPVHPRSQVVVDTRQRQMENRASLYPTRTTGSLVPITAGPENTSPAVGMNIPVNRYYMTPKGTNLLLQQAFEGSDFADTFARHRSNPALHSSGYPQLPTPESSLSATFHNNPGNTVLSRDGTSPTVSARSNETREPVESRPAGDMDSIFKDLAYLDTTEWATNREAGLRDFGFFDDTTFRAFCHDPDRLADSQPLIHPPNIADIWPPPGFYPETFQENTTDKPGS